MNHLKHIHITGKIQAGYAVMHAAYTFVPCLDGVSSLRYFFPLPQDGVLCGLQVLDKQNKLIRSSLKGATEEVPQQGISLKKMDEGIYCLQWVQSADAPFQVLIELLLPLKNGRLIFPTGFSFKSIENPMPPCTVSLSLEAESALSVSSPHQTITREGNTFTTEFSSGEDLVLDIQEQKMPQAWVQQRWQEYIGIYQVFAPPKEDAFQEVLLLLQLPDENQNLLKEALFRAFCALPQNICAQVQIMGERPVFDTLVPANDANREILYSYLANFVPGKESLPPLPLKHTLLIGDRFFKTSAPLTRLVVSPTAPLKKANHFHLYPGELSAPNMEKIIEAWLYAQTCPRILPTDNRVREAYPLSWDGCTFSFAVKGTGIAPEEMVIEWGNEKPQLHPMAKVSSLERFPLAEQLFASAKLKKLRQLLTDANPSSLRAIKQEMEDTAIHYGILSEESLFCIPADAGETAVFTEDLFLQNTPAPTYRTIFGEMGKQTHIVTEEALLAFLLSKVRKDGAICTAGSCGQRKIDQTAWAALALSAFEEYAAPVKEAQAFLAGKALSPDLSHDVPQHPFAGWDVISAAKQLLSIRKA